MWAGRRTLSTLTASTQHWRLVAHQHNCRHIFLNYSLSCKRRVIWESFLIMHIVTFHGTYFLWLWISVWWYNCLAFHQCICALSLRPAAPVCLPFWEEPCLHHCVRTRAKVLPRFSHSDFAFSAFSGLLRASTFLTCLSWCGIKMGQKC